MKKLLTTNYFWHTPEALLVLRTLCQTYRPHEISFVVYRYVTGLSKTPPLQSSVTVAKSVVTPTADMDSELQYDGLSFVQQSHEYAAVNHPDVGPQTDKNSLLLASLQTNRMQIALDIVVRLVEPLCYGVARGWQGIRGSNIVRMLRNVRASRQMLTNLMAFAVNTMSLSLSTVQVVHKIDPLLRMMKFRKTIPIDSTMTKVTAPQKRPPSLLPCIETAPEKCVTLNVLVEPPPGSPIRADVIFIHGLHGSLVKTWKQGLWNSGGRRVNFQRPPKPPVRPPKRPRHTHTIDPPHRSKRAKLSPTTPHGLRLNVIRSHSSHSLISTRSNSSSSMDTLLVAGSIDNIPKKSTDDCAIDYAYDCDVTGYDNDDVIEYLSEIEQNLPTFRMRQDDDRHLSEEDVDDDVQNDIDDLSRSVSRASTASSSSSSENSADYSRCWPGDWLPLDCPGVRVIAINYTTDPYLWRPIWIRKRNRTSLAERTREMMELLTGIGVGVGHPIVWVGHSKGGIFAKQIMVDAWESGKATLAPLWRSSRGCVFYSVPHRGSPLADFNLPLVRQSVELEEIKKNCSGVLELHRRFVALYRSGHLKIHIFSFVETALTLMSVLYLRIVGIDSADPGIGEVCGVHLDHREICKPRDRDCILYTKLTRMINKVS